MSKDPRITEASLSKLDDKRYPRPKRIRRYRAFLASRLAIAIVIFSFIIYPILLFITPSLIQYVIFNPSHIQTLYQKLSSSAAFLTVFIAIGILFIPVRYLAQKDLKRENTVLTQRNETVLAGFKLRHTLSGHKNAIYRIAWSPNGEVLASGSLDKTIRLWNTENGQLLRILRGHSGSVRSVAWSPDGQVLASGSFDKTIRLWNAQNGQLLRILRGHSGSVRSVAWSPDGQVLASGSDDKTIRLWNAENGQLLQALKGHYDFIRSVAWSPDGQILASGSADKTIRLWNAENGQLLQTLKGHSGSIYSMVWLQNGQTLISGSLDKTIQLWDSKTGRQLRTLEGHTDGVICIALSNDNRLLASKSQDLTVRLWRTDTWEMVADLSELSSHLWNAGLAFHPKTMVIATSNEEKPVICIWDLDLNAILSSPPRIPSFSYTNAKVVLVGDSGVGKSGLALVLTGKPFVETSSTHARHVWTFESQEVELDSGRKETRETLLWDLAGQPGYRLIHQLHLNEVAVALVVFDGRSETNPFAGVYHWVRALRLAQRIQGNSALPMQKFLVAARMDRGGIGVSSMRIKSQVDELSFDGYIETSAKDERNIAELKDTLRKAIDWEALPKVSSTDLFQYIKDFLVKEKESGRQLSTTEDMYHAFLNSKNAPAETKNLRTQFETCIGRVESRDLIRRLSFGNLVLLQPELLDVYASALINAVRDEPDGLGSIAEERARKGEFSIPGDERLKDKEQEKLLLIAMIEDLLRYEIALREQGNDEPYLVFPSQSTRENPALPNPEGKSVIFSFEGPVQNIYATLAVRLSHSALFKKKDMWRNAMTYTTSTGGTYGMFLSNFGEGRDELTLFFDAATSKEKRFLFEQYIEEHLRRRALPESIKRLRLSTCNNCNTTVTEEIVQKRLVQGLNWLNCPVCDKRVSILDQEENLTVASSSLIEEMDLAADTQRELGIAKSTLQGKIETTDFDVFLCHNPKDKPAVKQIGQQLKEQGILPWLDEWELPPGRPWQPVLERQIKHVKSAAVFVGSNGRGPWQNMILRAFLQQFVMRNCPVIPVVLPGCTKAPRLPLFLEGMTWVDFREQEPDPMEQLIWGITGKRETDLEFIKTTGGTTSVPD